MFGLFRNFPTRRSFSWNTCEKFVFSFLFLQLDESLRLCQRFRFIIYIDQAIGKSHYRYGRLSFNTILHRYRNGIYKYLKNFKNFNYKTILKIIIFLAFLLQTGFQDHNPWEFLKIFYYILLGDFGDFKGLDSSLNTNLYFLIVVGVSLALVIVMLNLLIAIISDSFEKVMALDKQAALY